MENIIKSLKFVKNAQKRLRIFVKNSIHIILHKALQFELGYCIILRSENAMKREVAVVRRGISVEYVRNLIGRDNFGMPCLSVTLPADGRRAFRFFISSGIRKCCAKSGFCKGCHETHGAVYRGIRPILQIPVQTGLTIYYMCTKDLRVNLKGGKKHGS